MTGKQKTSIVLLSGLYLLIPGTLAWITGRPFIFPSLGPTAYVLAFDLIPDRRHSSKTVIGGHACGLIGGLSSYHLLVAPNSFLPVAEPLYHASGFLVLGAIAALMITTFLMVMLNASHPPACATTLIVSLGIMPGFLDGLIIMCAVIVMYFSYRLVQGLPVDKLLDGIR